MKVTVAIPTCEGARTLGAVLAAVRRQRVDADVEILVCDSDSTDGSADLARDHGARVLTIDRQRFSHGGTRNLLVEQASGSHVAFLTQDAVPAGQDWLGELLRGFALAPDVALAFGPYLARPEASLPVRRELEAWFTSFAPDGQPRIDRLFEHERIIAPRELLGPRGFFTDANGCIAKEAWRLVPFRAVAYAEDHQLALDMLYAGRAKAYLPRAAVVHSHEYGLLAQLQRAFDEWRGLREVYGYVEPLSVAAFRRMAIGPLRADARALRAEGIDGARLAASVLDAAAHHTGRFAGALLGTRAGHLPPSLRRRLSLERRASFVPTDSITR